MARHACLQGWHTRTPSFAVLVSQQESMSINTGFFKTSNRPHIHGFYGAVRAPRPPTQCWAHRVKWWKMQWEVRNMVVWIFVLNLEFEFTCPLGTGSHTHTHTGTLRMHSEWNCRRTTMAVAVAVVTAAPSRGGSISASPWTGGGCGGSGAPGIGSVLIDNGLLAFFPEGG